MAALKIRIIQAGKVSSWRSQSIYHALAYTRTAETPDTIVLATPAEPYVSIGFHRSLENEIERNFCTHAGLPVIRRETGGGPVYLDKAQLFVQWIFNPDNLPKKVDARFRLFCQTLIDTYRFFDINADFSLPNDIHVGERKITGTGAGAIGNAEVLTGNFLFDFDVDTMISVLKYPSDAFRNMAREGMTQYLTHFKRELNHSPSQEAVASAYLNQCRDILKRPLEPGSFTAEELTEMDTIERKFASEEWLLDHQKTPKTNRLVKIHAGVWIGETIHRTPSGKSIHTLIRLKNGTVDDIQFSGDIDFRPAEKLKNMVNALKGVELNPEKLRATFETFFEQHQAASPGIEIADWIAAVVLIKQNKAMT